MADETLDRLLDWWHGGHSTSAAESRSVNYTDLAINAMHADVGIGGNTFPSAFNERTALGVCSFYAGVRAISETLASLPIVIEERSPGKADWEKVEDDELEWMLNYEPNHDQNGYQCHATRFVHRLIHGRSLTWVNHDTRAGGIRGIVPVHPHDVSFDPDDPLGFSYHLNLKSGRRVADRSEVLDLRGVATDGLNPISPLRLFAAPLALSKGAMEQGAGFWTNTPRPGLVVSNKGARLNPETQARVREDLATNYTGWKAGRPILLDGLEVHEYKMTFAEYQLLELMAANDENIGEKIFALPPGDLKKGQERAEWLEKYTLRPYLTEDEQEMLRVIAPTDRRNRLRIRRDLADLVRADIKTLYDSFRVGIMSGFIKINEVRAVLGKAPDPEGDKLYLPQSVFGKPGTVPTVNPMKGTNGRSRRSGERRQRPVEAPQVGQAPSSTAPDPRFVEVMSRDLRSLFARESRAVLDYVRKPEEYSQRLTDFYAKHKGIVRDRLAPFTDTTARKIVDAVEAHEVRLRDAGHSPDALARIEEAIAGFEAEASRLAVEILS